MSLPSAKIREVVFQFLFCYDFFESEEQDILKALMHLHKITKKSARDAYLRMTKIKEHLSEIDEKIASASKNYAFDRICRAERNLLRLSVFELFYDDEIPPKVAISEAIRLTRKYSSRESATFINAVLDFLYQGSLEEQKAAL